MPLLNNFRIVRTALHVPETIETADDLAPRLQRSADWIRAQAGVAERRIASESMAVMGARAARQVLADGPPPDLIINASLTPIQLLPDSSVFIQQELGLSGIPSFSIHATCLSFIVALHQAAVLLQTGCYQRILIVSAEQGSICRNYEHPESAALIGDGAAAALVEACEEGGSELLAWEMQTWPEGAHLAELRGCGTRRHPNDPATSAQDNLFCMDGAAIYRLTAVGFARVVQALLSAADLAPEQIDLIVPHQPSGPALALLPRYGFPADRVVNIIEHYGNCIAASIPMALAHAQATGLLQRGRRVLIVGTSAGVSVAGAVLRW